MARPKPEVLLQHKNDVRDLQVLSGEVYYGVFYKGEPIGLRNYSSYPEIPHKYRRTSFVNSGTASNAARKLNKLFNTEDFVVYELVRGKIFTED